VNGVDHKPWFQNDVFSRAALAELGAATSVHAWIKFTGALQLYSPDEVGCLHLTEYCIELANAYATDLGRPVWLQEFGASSEWMDEEMVPDFAEASIRNAASARNLWGCTWWCSHDLNPIFTEFDPLEYDLGLLDHENGVKPVGERVAQVIREFKAQPPRPPKRAVALVLPDNMLAQVPGDVPPGWQFAATYMDLIEDDVRPSIVLESRAKDEAYLAARGIEALERVR
jgi:hypothetical protein